jgi:hypothetical protein
MVVMTMLDNLVPATVRARRRRQRDAGDAAARVVSDEDEEYLADDELFAGDRAGLREFLTPRRAIGGALVWPVSELRPDD